MKHVLVLLAALAIPVYTWPDDATAPPKTRTDNVKDTLHGVEIVDPYRWLEDQKSPETRAWIAEQQKYTETMLSRLPGRDAIVKRLGELLKADSMSTPSYHSGRYFFSKRTAEQDMPVFYVRDGWGGSDEVLLDCNTLSKDKSVSASPLDITDDGKTWIYGLRRGGEDEVTVKMRDVDSKRDLNFEMPRARYFGVQLTSDKKGLYFSRQDKNGPRVYFRPMEGENQQEKLIFGEGYGPGKIISAGISEDGKYLLLTVFHGSAADKTEIYVKDLASNGPIMPIVNDVTARFQGRFGGDTLFLQTNWKAPNNRILAVDLKNPGKEHWKEVVAEGKNVLQSFTPIGGNLFVSYLENAVTRLKKVRLVHSIKDGDTVEAPAPKDGLGSLSISGRWDRKDFFWTYTSFMQPPTIHYYRRNEQAHQFGVWWQSSVPVKTEEFEVKQVRYASKDGTDIPMFLVHRKGLKLDGNNPVFLTGYGGFNLSRTPAFAATVALWVEQGGVYALPSLRGGGEFGEAWHKAGMLNKKQNVFDDFIAAAEYLIKEGYTNPKKLAIAGGSNGGLLVGAALTQRPELFQAVVCAVPLLDMVRFHKFLVARFWVPEYGSAENPEQFKFIHAYSPYHRVKPGTKYPAVLFVTGDADTRVDPLHARKMCALLQAATGSDPADKPVLLHYDTKAGHSAGKPVSKQIEDNADEFAFLFWQLGVKVR